MLSCRALSEVLQYEYCSLVQAAGIPACLGQEDVIAKARTGTGKTLAFIIPIIEKVSGSQRLKVDDQLDVHLVLINVTLSTTGMMQVIYPHFLSSNVI